MYIWTKEKEKMGKSRYLSCQNFPGMEGRRREKKLFADICQIKNRNSFCQWEDTHPPHFVSFQCDQIWRFIGLWANFWSLSATINFCAPRHCALTYFGANWLQTVRPDWVVYWTLGNFLKPLAKINLPKSPTFLGNFCKGI